MDEATNLAIRAIVSGLRYSRRIDDADCIAIIAAIDAAGTEALHHPRKRLAAGYLDKLAADVARDSLGANHPIALEALQKSQTD